MRGWLLTVIHDENKDTGVMELNLHVVKSFCYLKEKSEGPAGLHGLYELVSFLFFAFCFQKRVHELQVMFEEQPTKVENLYKNNSYENIICFIIKSQILKYNLISNNKWSKFKKHQCNMINCSSMNKSEIKNAYKTIHNQKVPLIM